MTVKSVYGYAWYPEMVHHRANSSFQPSLELSWKKIQLFHCLELSSVLSKCNQRDCELYSVRCTLGSILKISKLDWSVTGNWMQKAKQNIVLWWMVLLEVYFSGKTWLLLLIFFGPQIKIFGFEVSNELFRSFSKFFQKTWGKRTRMGCNWTYNTICVTA